MSSTYQLTLSPESLDHIGPQAKAVLSQTRSQLGFIQNMHVVMANSPGLLETYLDGYARFRAGSGFTPPEQEVVFLTISRENRCHYCMAAHSTFADIQSKVSIGITDAIRDGREITDLKLGALNAFTRVMFDRRGLPVTEDVKAFLDAGYTERHILEIVLAIGIKTLSNYANHLFNTPVDGLFSDRLWDEMFSDPIWELHP